MRKATPNGTAAPLVWGRRWRGSCAAALVLLGSPAAALEYAPVINASVMGGQYFFKGNNANVSGDVSVLAASAVKVSERWAWLPMYTGGYQGTKGVSDGVPAGSLYQQQMDHRASLTGIYSVAGTGWKVKGSASYKYEFLKQTRDEEWGYGLFDYEKIGTGMELENTYREPFNFRMALDFYRIRFPNYQSLESDAPLDPQGNPLTRATVNRNVLDTYNAQMTVGGSRPFPYESPKVSLQASYSLLYQMYADQSRVDTQGQVKMGTRRHDFLQTAAGSVGYPRPVRLWGRDCRLDSKFNLRVAHNGSNQNYFDAKTAQFFADANSYTSFGLGPSFNLAWGDSKRPTSVGAGFSFSHYRYAGRRSQTGDGLYTGDRLVQTLYVASISGAYPIAPGFYLKGQTNMLWARSNNTYEKYYSYNYRTANYLMGFTYEF